jgi:type VI secretion system secreted protein VgrG
VLEESVTSNTTALKDGFHQGYRNRFQATPWDVPNPPKTTDPRRPERRRHQAQK